jgi:hypothetical protein
MERLVLIATGISVYLALAGIFATAFSPKEPTIRTRVLFFLGAAFLVPAVVYGAWWCYAGASRWIGRSRETSEMLHRAAKELEALARELRAHVDLRKLGGVVARAGDTMNHVDKVVELLWSKKLDSGRVAETAAKVTRIVEEYDSLRDDLRDGLRRLVDTLERVETTLETIAQADRTPLPPARGGASKPTT